MDIKLMLGIAISALFYFTGTARTSGELTDAVIGDTLDPVHRLEGTTVLTSSEKNLESRWVYGLGLNRISVTPCQSSGEKVTPTTITSIKQLNDSMLVIKAMISANCGYDFLGEIEVVSDSTLNLIYHGYGSYASCSCCFGLTYEIEIMRDPDYDMRKLKYVTVNGVARKSLPPIR
jgi:hypothetical protein